MKKRRAINILLGLSFWAMASIAVSATVVSGDFVVKTSPDYGGAVYSVQYKSMEFIDAADHGRLLQSAVSFDGLGECYNPTEGGSILTSKTQNSSVLRSETVVGNEIWSKSDMGFWLAPGMPYPNGCGGNTAIKTAQNTLITSPYSLFSQYTIGLKQYPNVIARTVTYLIPNPHQSATFEALTGYIPMRYSKSIYYNPESGEASDTGNSLGEQRHPVIHYEPTKKYAIGVYSPGLPQNWHGDLVGYGRFSFPWASVNKFNCVFRALDIKANSQHSFQCLVVFGSLDEVEKTISQLNADYKKQYQPPW